MLYLPSKDWLNLLVPSVNRLIPFSFAHLRLDHLKSYAYLTYILDELRKMGAFPKEEELKKLLPWSEDLPEYCRTKLKK